MDYQQFLEQKAQAGARSGFDPVFMPDCLFDFQESLTEWAIQKGRGALFTDCGTGKTLMSLTWAQNVVQKTNKPVLFLTPLAVTTQVQREGEKFGIESAISKDGRVKSKITVTNYEKLSKFDPADYVGVVCDESSRIKSDSARTRLEVTSFMRKIPYRLLATATASPNDYIELGTSSEALGYLGHMDMLNKFFKNDNNNSGMRRMYGENVKWRFRGHAEIPFWRWVCSWSRALRRPSDLGFSDDGFILPPLSENEHVVEARTIADGCLFDMPAADLREQREERRRTLVERCEKVAELVDHDSPALVWCHLNDEGDLLEKLIPDAVQVSGRDSDDAKEEKMLSFVDQQSRVMVIKPKIGGFGLNLQHCSHVTFFPSHSYEQYYQAVRRCWRFGQKSPVTVDLVMTEGDRKVMSNLQRKSKAADEMFTRLVAEMNNAIHMGKIDKHTNRGELPKWM